MGTCEDRCPSIDLANQITLDAASKGPDHTHVADRQDSSQQFLIHKLDNFHIEDKEEQVAIEDEKVVEQVVGFEENDGPARGEEEDREMEQDQKNNEEQQQQQNNECKVPPYPLRSNAEDCSFYMKTGSCKYGFTCRFNHPLNRVSQVVDADGKDHYSQGTDLSGKIACKYYSAPGGCKFGDTCRYSHFKEETDNDDIELNFLGLPIRKKERECPYYMRNGSCGYGSNCRFHHPDPTAAMEEPNNLVSQGGALQGAQSFAARNVAADCAPLMSSMPQTTSMPQTMSNSLSSDTYVPWMNHISQGMPQRPPYNQYQVPISLPDQTMNSQPGYSVTSPLKKAADPFGFNQPPMQSEEFPERPGQPDCDHFLRTGTCKFGSHCKYHHPRNRLYGMPNGAIHNVTKETSHLTYQTQIQMEEFPERPGEPECAFFMRNGDCKYKSSCKYNHPKGRNPKLGASTYDTGSSSRSFSQAPLISSHEARKLPDLYPSHSNQMAKPYIHQQQPASAEEFPYRPGQVDCDYFIKTGDCKFKYTCKFHHPRSLISQVATRSDVIAIPDLNEKGLPLRPGAKMCRNYEQLGICKYGPRCLFDHPSSSNSSALPESSVPESPLDNSSGWDDDWVIN